jgi:multidrug transporter EmrE-like cation transporter
MGASTIAAVFLLQLAISLPAIVVFPVAQGIALIGGVVLMALIYKERINKFKVIEAILGLMVIIQAVFR